jgi:hypothetical protein
MIQPANYDQHLEELRSCDLLIEAIAERRGLEGRSLPADRALSQRAGDSGHQHLRLAAEPVGRIGAGGCAASGSAASISSIRRATWRWWS